MKDMWDAERRKHIRIEDHLHVNVEYDNAATRKKTGVVARGVNISENGIEVITDAVLPKKRYIDLEIDFPSPYLRVFAKAKIAWRNDEKLKYGLQFVRLNKEFMKLIKFYVNRPTITRKLKILIPRGRS